MTEFERLVLEKFDRMDKKFDQMDKRFDRIEKRLDNIEDQIEELKEESEITRAATNRNGEKLEELVTLLNNTNVVSFKY